MDQLFTGTAILGLLAYLAVQLRELPKTIWDQIKKCVVFTAHIEESSTMYRYFELWLADHHKSVFKNVSIDVNGDSDGSEKLRVSHFEDFFTLQYAGKRLLVRKQREKAGTGNTFSNLYFNSFSIEGWMAKPRILTLLNEVLEYNRSMNRNPVIYSNDGYGGWFESGTVMGKSLENMVLNEKESIISDITSFINHEDWYNKRGIQFKRGYLFYGAPGNGKTSLSLAISKYFNRDIYVLNINDITKDDALINAFSRIKNKSILLIEDIDVILGNRKSESKVSFSALLNCMDGAFSKYGLITIMTTNHIEVLDEALIREGRIDMKVSVGNPSSEMVDQYLSLFFNTQIHIGAYQNSLSMAKIQEICMQNREYPNRAAEEILHLNAFMVNQKQAS